jgi:MFS family permease
VGFAGGIPAWLFTLYGGVVADRVSRRTVLFITQFFMMLLAFVLAALTFLGMVEPWHIIALAFGLGVANAFDAPARQSFVLEMIDREDLTNAIALNSTMNNTATVVGPAAAGITYALFGPAWCFVLNGISFIAVILALGFMKLAPHPRTIRWASAHADLREGIQYAFSHPTVRMLIVIAGVTSLLGIATATLIPAWAVNVLNGDATTNGWLQSARGVGALIGSLIIAALSRRHIEGKILAFGTFAFPVVLLGFAVARWLPLSLLAMLGVGIFMVFVMNLANALLQMTVSDGLRARVMSLHTLTFFGMMPLGALLIGAAAEYWDEPTAIVTSSVILVGFAALVWFRAPWLHETNSSR